MISTGLSRPSIPEYPQIAEHIREAIDQIYNGTNKPRQALDDAAKSAKALGMVIAITFSNAVYITPDLGKEKAK